MPCSEHQPPRSRHLWSLRPRVCPGHIVFLKDSHPLQSPHQAELAPSPTLPRSSLRLKHFCLLGLPMDTSEASLWPQPAALHLLASQDYSAFTVSVTEMLSAFLMASLKERLSCVAF